MKKNLLFLFTLSGIFSTAYGQDTYINDAIVVKVNPNTLFYNGGSLNVNTTATTGATEKIINQGNIQIQGGFTNANPTGKNFVNEYTSDTSYGQLIISDEGEVTGRVTMEKSKIDYTNNDYFAIGLPYQSQTVKDIFEKFTGETFTGDCAVDTNCGKNYYNQSALVWDVKETEYDPVTSTSQVRPGSDYTFKITNSNFKTFLENLGSSAIKFSTYGIPNNKLTSFDFTGENASSIVGYTQAEFSNMKYGEWKNKKNHYNEFYYTSLGESTSNNSNVRYAKNLHRFSNPFTSNLDLSDTSWLRIIINGTEFDPIDIFNNVRYKVSRLPSDYYLKWDIQTGGSNIETSPVISAYLTGANGSYTWAGDPDALIIKPFEYFYVDYYTLSNSRLGNSNIVNAKYNFSDTQKTFNYASSLKSSSSNESTGKSARTISLSSNANSINSEATKDFTQVELFLTDDDMRKGQAAYLVNSSFYKTGTETKKENNVEVENYIFLYEESENGEVLENKQTLVNEFNNSDYIGKPLRIGFKSLVEGNKYKIKLRLFQQSIFNKVDDFSTGKYYLLDKVKNTVDELNSSTDFSFTASSESVNNNRFELYWKEKPEGTLDTNDLSKTNTTYLYYDSSKNQFIRFEKSNTTANIAVFDLTGRQIFSKDAVSTNTDYQLNLSNIPSVYVVKITYKDGKTVTKKTIKK